MTNNDELERNPILTYADSYRSMANQGAESVPVWGVITDLERNIAPLYTALLAERDADKKLIAELEGELESYHERLVWMINDAHEWERKAINNFEECGNMSQRIAELEARTVSVKPGEVLVTVTGFTGCGKSAIAGEIEIAMLAIGVPVEWTNGDAEKRTTGADWLSAIEMYKPTVRIVEINVPRAGIKLDVGE